MGSTACQLCTLRLSGTRTAGEYGQASAEAAADTPVCSLCLGTLEERTLDAACRAVAEAAVAYEVTQFTLNIQLPSSMLVRERAAKLKPSPADAAAAAADSAAATRADIVDVKEALRWALMDRLARATGLVSATDAALQISVLVRRPCAEEAMADLDLLRPLLPPPPRSRPKRKWGRGGGRGGETGGGQGGEAGGGRGGEAGGAEAADSIRSVLKALSSERADQLLRASALCPPQPPSRPNVLSVSVEHAAVFLGGRYLKLSRQLPQTAWIIDGERLPPSPPPLSPPPPSPPPPSPPPAALLTRALPYATKKGVRKCPSSVEEIIAAPVLKAFDAASLKFHSVAPRSPEMARDGSRWLEMARDHPRRLEMARDLPRSPEITRDGSITRTSPLPAESFP